MLLSDRSPPASDEGGDSNLQRQIFTGKRGFTGAIWASDDDDHLLSHAQPLNPPIISRIRSVTCFSSASITSNGLGGVNT